MAGIPILNAVDAGNDFARDSGGGLTVEPESVEAIVAGVRAVEATGLRVLRVDADDWVTLGDVAQRVERSRETVRLWALGRMGPGGFPPPLNPGRDTTFYSWAEVSRWLRVSMGLPLPEEEPALVAANLAVQLRALMPRVPQARSLLQLLTYAGRGTSRSR
jgi:hypothetical protein